MAWTRVRFSSEASNCFLHADVADELRRKHHAELAEAASVDDDAAAGPSHNLALVKFSNSNFALSRPQEPSSVTGRLDTHWGVVVDGTYLHHVCHHEDNWQYRVERYRPSDAHQLSEDKPVRVSLGSILLAGSKAASTLGSPQLLTTRCQEWCAAVYKSCGLEPMWTGADVLSTVALIAVGAVLVYVIFKFASNGPSGSAGPAAQG